MPIRSLKISEKIKKCISLIQVPPEQARSRPCQAPTGRREIRFAPEFSLPQCRPMCFPQAFSKSAKIPLTKRRHIFSCLSRCAHDVPLYKNSAASLRICSVSIIYACPSSQSTQFPVCPSRKRSPAAHRGIHTPRNISPRIVIASSSERLGFPPRRRRATFALR